MAKPRKIELPDNIFERFVDAHVEMDLDALRDTLADDTTWLSGGPGWMVHGADGVVSVRSREWDNPNAKIRSLKWIDGPYGEQQGDLICAWGIVQLEMDVKEPEKTAERLDKRCVMILRRDEGEWRVLMDCWSRPRINEYVTFFDDDPKTVSYYDYSEVAAPLT
jgi:ketosteroid isomerase-like protein